MYFVEGEEYNRLMKENEEMVQLFHDESRRFCSVYLSCLKVIIGWWVTDTPFCYRLSPSHKFCQTWWIIFGKKTILNWKEWKRRGMLMASFLYWLCRLSFRMANKRPSCRTKYILNTSLCYENKKNFRCVRKQDKLDVRDTIAPPPVLYID